MLIALRWSADDGPLLVLFGIGEHYSECYSKRRRIWPPLAILSGSMHALYTSRLSNLLSHGLVDPKLIIYQFWGQSALINGSSNTTSIVTNAL